MSVWALLPVKRLQGAKARLSDILSEEERSALARAMLLDVIAALKVANRVDVVALVTDDEDAIQIAQDNGCQAIAEPELKGLNPALSHGLSHAISKGATSALILHGDVPLAKAEEIDELVGFVQGVYSVAIGTAASDGGTNGMALCPPDCLPLMYGVDSAAKHVTAADDLELLVTHLEMDGLGLDIDQPENLQAFLERAEQGHTLDYLLATGLDKRLKERTT